MALTTGARGTAATLGVGSDQLVIDMADAIYRLEPNNNPLVLLSTEVNRAVATQTKYNHLEDARQPRYTRINNGGGYTSAETGAMTVDDGTVFSVGNIVRNMATGEVMRVTASASTTVTLTRSWGATVAATVTDDDYLYIIGDSHAENADVRSPKTTTPTTVYNYTGIYRDSIGISDTADNVKYYGEDEITRQRINAGLEHADKIERGFFLGERNENTSGDYPIRTTGGLYEFVTTNVTTETALTEAEFITFLRAQAFAEGSDEKWLFCSGIITEAIMFWAKNKLQLKVDETTYGIRIYEFISPFGVLNIKTHKGLQKMGFDGTVAGGIGFVVDPSAVGYRNIANRDTRLLKNRQGAGVDGRIDEYLTECGLWIANEAKHAILKGVTSYT